MTDEKIIDKGDKIILKNGISGVVIVEPKEDSDTIHVAFNPKSLPPGMWSSDSPLYGRIDKDDIINVVKKQTPVKVKIKSWDEINVGTYYLLTEDTYSGLTKIAADTKVLCVTTGSTCVFAVLEGLNTGLLIYEYEDDHTSSPEKYAPIEVIISKIPEIQGAAIITESVKTNVFKNCHCDPICEFCKYLVNDNESHDYQNNNYATGICTQKQERREWFDDSCEKFLCPNCGRTYESFIKIKE
jgi:hypothetical protein